VIKIDQIFRIVYLGDMLIKLITIIDREGGKKLTKPLYKFEHLKCGTVFTCRQEDLDKAFKFKDWIPVVVDDTGNIKDKIH